MAPGSRAGTQQDEGCGRAQTAPGCQKIRVKLRTYQVRICDPCYLLEGEQCDTPECVFCRRTMVEVGEYLDALLIRPVVDGERLDLYPARRNMRRPAKGEVGNE